MSGLSGRFRSAVTGCLCSGRTTVVYFRGLSLSRSRAKAGIFVVGQLIPQA
jgi:hypothetical protein